MCWPAVEAFVRGRCARLLAPAAVLAIYGPFRYAGRSRPRATRRSTRMLRERDPASGMRDFEAVDRLARRRTGIPARRHDAGQQPVAGVAQGATLGVMTRRIPAAHSGASCAALTSLWLASCGGGSGSPGSPPPSPPAPPPPPPNSGLDARPRQPSPALPVTVRRNRSRSARSARSPPCRRSRIPCCCCRLRTTRRAGSSSSRVARCEPSPTNPVSRRPLFSSTSRVRVRSGGEQGLLGMAFHPDFPTDPRVYPLVHQCDGRPRFADLRVPHA